MRILVLGGDGFVGWPISLRLSKEGHDVTVVDNFARRSSDQELGVDSLTPIGLMAERVKVWRAVTGNTIVFKRIDIAKNYFGLLDVINKIRPDVVIHLAEQRAAPYSMKTPHHKRYTVSNNIVGTHNVLCAIVESGLDVHLVHIGTAGVYGYESNEIPIPEGYLDFFVSHNGNDYPMRDYYPMRPGSIYHMTKTMDSLMFRFYAKNDLVRITDLHQGVIWGVDTDETRLHEGLVNRFDYCGDYGTVLNRFLVQAVIDHPLTLYGKGKQTRAFIHLQNSADCVMLAVYNPPKRGEEVKIFNQTTEQLCLKDLADIVSRLTDAKVEHFPNPRIEVEDNILHMENDQFLELGLDPIKVDSDKLDEVCRLAYKYKDRINREAIISTSYWREDRRVEVDEKPFSVSDQSSTERKAARASG